MKADAIHVKTVDGANATDKKKSGRNARSNWREKMKELHTIHPGKDDVIIHTFGKEASIENSMRLNSELIHTFPDNHVIAVPDTDSVYCLDKPSTIEMLQAMIEMLKE